MLPIGPLMKEHRVIERIIALVARQLETIRKTGHVDVEFIDTAGAGFDEQREPDGDMLRFVFDQRHILTMVASYRFGKGWETGFRFRLVTGRPETPINDGIQDADSGLYDAVFGERLSVDQPVFHQLDLRAQYTWIFDLWRMSLYLDVQNVYNAANPEATLWDYRFRESGPLRGLPILPTLGIKGSF